LGGSGGGATSADPVPRVGVGEAGLGVVPVEATGAVSLGVRGTLGTSCGGGGFCFGVIEETSSGGEGTFAACCADSDPGRTFSSGFFSA
jgi:hypothetical protein